MADRASTFSDPTIIKLLQTRFIPVAIDQAYERRQQDTEGEFYRKIAGQGPRSNFNGTTQGMYIAAANGTLLGFSNNRGPGRIERLILQSLEKFSPGDVPDLPRGKADPRFDTHPPKGGLVIRVTSKVLGGYEQTDNPRRIARQTALGRDNLWVRKDEHAALIRGTFPESLARRLARFHLVDNTRGEPPMWRSGEIKSLDVSIENGRMTGSVHLETRSGDRGFQADLFGNFETAGEAVTRFDLVAKGKFWGEGRYTRGAPKGKFPFAVAFTLATGTDEADKVPPQGSRGWLDGYLR